MAAFQKLTQSQSFAQLNNNSHQTLEDCDFGSDFTNNLQNNTSNNLNSKNSHNPITLRQKSNMSMSMIDENSNTIPFFQKRHSMKSSYVSQNDQLFQIKPSTQTQRQPFEEIVSLQPQFIYYSSQTMNGEEQQNPIQNTKYTTNNMRVQQQGMQMNQYSNDLSPIEMTQLQLSTQSSSPDFDLAIIKNPSSSSSHANISTKTGSFLGSGQNNGMTNSQQMNSSNALQRNSSQQQMQMLASKGYKNYSQSGNSMHDIGSVSTRTTSMSTNESTGINRNKSHNYTFQDENDENSQARQNHFIDQMECQEVEDFSLYIQEYQKNKAEPMQQQQQKQTVSQEDIYQEQLFGNNPKYVPKYGYEIVQNLFKQQKNYKITVITDPRELIIRENLIDLMSRLHSRLRLQDETFYLAVNIFARFLDLGEKQSFSSNKIIVLVATCLFVAAKYQEIYPPSLNDFIAVLKMHKISVITQDILEWEGSILNKLNFSLFGPTRLQFLEAYSSQIALDPSQLHFCSYLLELTNLNHSFYKYDHSEIAASTILLSEKFKNISGKYFWSDRLEILTNYKQTDIYECVEELYEYLVDVGLNRRHFFIYSKYSDPKYKSVSKIDYDLTNNINNQNSQKAQQNTQDIPVNYSQNVNSEEVNYSQAFQQQQNFQYMTQSQQLNQSINQGCSNNYNSNNMTQSTYINYSQNNQHCDSQQQQYFSQQMTQNLQAPCSKAKSECFNEEYNENSMNYMSEARYGQTNRQYDITRYLKKYKPSYKQ